MFLNLFHPDWAQAVGWMFLHSLWQGTLIFVLTLPLLVLTKKHSPRVRYNILCLALFALVGSMAVTFYHYIPESRAEIVWLETATLPVADPYSASQSAAGSEKIIPAPDIQLPLRESVGHFIQLYSGYLVNIWLLGFCFFGFRWLGGLVLTYQLKSKGTMPVEVCWQQKVNQWSKAMGIRKNVELLESLKTEVPLILGHLKPMVLLPIGTLNGLAPEQVEAIIIHELAHIRRHDFMMNLVVAALEMVLFYHPVYWWLSNQIQQEREQCCDDIAVAVCGNARLYAQTLLLMEEKRQQNSLAMAYQGKKHHLLERIKRICLASPASYRPEYGKAGLSLAFLLALAVMSWAKMPTKVDLVTPAVTSLSQLITVNQPEETETQAAVPEEPEKAAALPELPAVPNSLPPTVAEQPTFAPTTGPDTIPYAPDIPAMGIEPKLPAAPNFPYTPESLAEALQNPNNEKGFLANTISNYESELRSWQNSLRTGYLESWKDRMNLIIATYQDWKNDMDQYRKQDLIAYLVAMKKGIRYFENELKTHEKAVKKAENAVKGDMENYIKTFENTIKNHENQQADRESRMAVHDDRMHIHDLRMAAHDGRMSIHDNRMSLHDTRMMFHDERMKAHDEIMKAFEQEFFASLEADGLGKKEDKKLDFVLENGKITVNGTVLNAELTQKYTQLLKKYGFEPPKDGTFFFKISEKNRSIGTSGNYSMSRKED